jgi:hypothetical protein
MLPLSAYIPLRSPAANVSQLKVLIVRECSLLPLNRLARQLEGNTESSLDAEVLQLKGDMEGVDPWDFFLQP